MKKTVVQLLISLLLITNTWQNVALAASLPIVSSHHPTAIINSINNTDSATTTYWYNDLDQLTSVQNPHDWSAREQKYSQDGDLITAADGKEYTFNGQDQLVKVKLKNGKTINYQYYPNGLRSDRIIKNGEHVRFYYDQSGHVLATENVTATQKIKHSFFLSGLGKDMATVAEYNTQNNQDSYYVHQNGDTVMMLAHAVGNGVLKSGGLEVMGNQHYDAYGNPKALGDSYLATAFKLAHLQNNNQDNNANNSNSLNTNAANNFTYKGEYQDVDSNIVYLKARDYDPTSARFLSRDSYDVWNHYSYADSDPVNKIDPSGHLSQGTKTALNIGIYIIGMLGMILSDGAIGAYFSSANGLSKAFGFGVMVGKNEVAMFLMGVAQGAVSGVDPVDSGLEAAGLNNYGKGFAQNFLSTLVWAVINIKGPGDPSEELFKTMRQRKWTFMAQGPFSYLTSKVVGTLYGDKFITKDDTAPFIISLVMGPLWDTVTETAGVLRRNAKQIVKSLTQSFFHTVWGAVLNESNSMVTNEDKVDFLKLTNQSINNSMMFSSIFSM
ncbi:MULTISPECIES: RHS repeat-associated core domain-containing protein [Cysteiniphilum]|uniref:RHS repeat-associated core domain-containing protein n=1 Tax=Cysteiniphilum TaxID=2056696 RepID=UPI00177AFB05|nr:MULTISPECIES: RHS repeat-associated core domain-containing protein [Cysteiniphilum]